MSIKNIIINFKKYSFLLQQLISRDFKVKYKRSVLGIVWSLLYPVLNMAVMALVFSNVFKFSTPGINYLVYVLSGLIMFNYYSEASNLAMSSVVANFPLINKIYIPKYIFPLSKCLFCRNKFSTNINSFIYCYFGYWNRIKYISFGITLCIYGIVITLWTYLTPIMYDISLISPHLQVFFKLNPMYHYINFIRRVILYHEMPSAFTFGVCALSSIVVLVIGVVVFRKNQDKFIYYV